MVDKGSHVAWAAMTPSEALHHTHEVVAVLLMQKPVLRYGVEIPISMLFVVADDGSTAR
jgi:hypothetical protein